jgi:hypothetical protein
MKSGDWHGIPRSFMVGLVLLLFSCTVMALFGMTVAMGNGNLRLMPPHPHGIWQSIAESIAND